jgi:rifampicin phosphotransferase
VTVEPTAAVASPAVHAAAPRPPSQPSSPDGTALAWHAVTLDDPRSAVVALTGAKAARLAEARAAGLPVLDGWVLPVPLVACLQSRAAADGLRRVWTAVAPSAPLVARSSSPGEDGETSSQAGCFTSVAGVATWEGFCAAVDDVARSAHGGPMAVLVQPQIVPRMSGVLFGVHPVTGDPRPLLAVVPGSPAPLVSGQVPGELFVLDRRGARQHDGRRVRSVLGVPARRLSRRLRQLADQCAALFGGRQDMEWALDGDGRLWLLQSRPVTRVAGRVDPKARLVGPGPVGETLPAPLWPLEADLWVPPLDAGLRGALSAVGAATPDSGLVRVVHDRAVADLVALGVAGDRQPGLLAVLDPRPGLRRASRAWPTARLARAWPGLASDLVRHLDRLLCEVPELDGLDDAHLLGTLGAARQALVASHGYEALAGLAAVPAAAGRSTVTGAGTALSVLARLDPLGDDAERIARHPSLLALAPPSIAPVRLPASPAGRPARAVAARPDDPALLREALRLRTRWLQELQAQVVRELGRRLHGRGQLVDALAVRELRLEELEALLADPTRRHLPDASRRPRAVALPTAFRLDDAGVPVAERGERPSGTGAGGGRCAGVVVHRDDPLPTGEPAVLVVDVLDPALAAVLPSLAGLVSETGNPLSHVAILAREHGVATVVGVAGARSSLQRGQRVVVDGRTGTVTPEDPAPEQRP